MLDEGARPPRDPAEPVLVRGQRLGAVMAAQRAERVQVAGQRRVLRSRREADVRRDPRQQVIAGQQHVVVGVVQADVPGRVPGRPDHPHPPARQVERVAVVQQHVRLGQAEHAEHLGEVGVEISHDVGGRAGAGQPGLHGIGLRCLPDPGRKGVYLGGVHRDRRPRCLAEAAAEPVVVEVHVGDDDPGDSVGRQARGRKPGHEVLPAALVIPARVHDQRAGVGKQQVGERVAKRVVRDRHRHGPHAGADPLDRRQFALSPRLPLGQPGHRHRGRDGSGACRGASAPRHAQLLQIRRRDGQHNLAGPA